MHLSEMVRFLVQQNYHNLQHQNPAAALHLEDSLNFQMYMHLLVFYFHRFGEYITAMEHSGQMDSVKAVLDVIESV